jgi:hypothetical protein
MLDGDPPLPEVAAVRPEQLQQAAMAPDAPAELKAVAAAVRVGRTSWAVVAAGTGDQLPEVRALYAYADRRLDAALAEGEEPVEAQPPRPRVLDYEDDGDMNINLFDRR